MQTLSIDDEKLPEIIGEDKLQQLKDEIDLFDGAGAEFDIDLVSKGELSPVFFWLGTYQFWCRTVFGRFP